MKPNPRLRLAVAGTLTAVVLLGAAAFVTGSSWFLGGMLVAVVAGCAVIAACVPSRSKTAPAGATITAQDRVPRLRSGLSLADIMIGMVAVALVATVCLSFIPYLSR